MDFTEICTLIADIGIKEISVTGETFLEENTLYTVSHVDFIRGNLLEYLCIAVETASGLSNFPTSIFIEKHNNSSVAVKNNICVFTQKNEDKTLIYRLILN